MCAIADRHADSPRIEATQELSNYVGTSLISSIIPSAKTRHQRQRVEPKSSAYIMLLARSRRQFGRAVGPKYRIISAQDATSKEQTPDRPAAGHKVPALGIESDPLRPANLPVGGGLKGIHRAWPAGRPMVTIKVCTGSSDAARPVGRSN